MTLYDRLLLEANAERKWCWATPGRGEPVRGNPKPPNAETLLIRFGKYMAAVDRDIQATRA